MLPGIRKKGRILGGGIAVQIYTLQRKGTSIKKKKSEREAVVGGIGAEAGHVGGVSSHRSAQF